MTTSVQSNCMGMLVHDFVFLGMNYEEISRKQQEMSSRLPRPATAKHAKEKNMIASTATGRAREEEGRSMILIQAFSLILLVRRFISKMVLASCTSGARVYYSTNF